MAGLEGGVINPSEALGGGSCIEAIGGGGEKFCNSGHTDYGAVGLVEALKVSSDTYFFTVGELANSHGDVIQNKARELGIGEQTGIDLPSELTGTIPSRQWLIKQNEAESQCTREHHGRPCHIVAEPGEPWTVGYNMDLAVGQGSLQTDPLQMAVAYSTLANAYIHGGEGEVVTPHLGRQIDESSGGLVQSLSQDFPPKRHVHLNYSDLSDVMQGIHEARLTAGRHLGGRVDGLETSPSTPSTARRGRPNGRGTWNSRGTCASSPTPGRPIVLAVDRRRRRLRRRNRRADRPPDRVEVVRPAGEVRGGNLENVSDRR